MTGVILCGGQSSRMHKDKGLLHSGSFTWAAKMAGLLKPVCSNLAISVNPQQHAYQSELAGYRLITDDDSLGIYGPLLGLMSTHLKFPEEDIFLLACDMQQMQQDVLETMANHYRENPLYEAWIYREAGGDAEPLAGIYAAKALHGILKKHLELPLPAHSMKYLLKQLNVCYHNIPQKWETCFANFNTPGDLEGMLQ